MALSKVSSLMLDTLGTAPPTPVKGQIIAEEPSPGTLVLKLFNGTSWEIIGKGAVGTAGNAVFFENDTVITANYTVTAGKNAGTFGPVDVAAGVEVDVLPGSEWSIV